MKNLLGSIIADSKSEKQVFIDKVKEYHSNPNPLENRITRHQFNQRLAEIATQNKKQSSSE